MPRSWRGPDLFVVACDGGKLIGAVLGAYDGRRGWLYHLAVSPERRLQSVGRSLVETVERRLKDKGCRKVNLLIYADNARVIPFYERLGYEKDELVFMAKWLS